MAIDRYPKNAFKWTDVSFVNKKLCLFFPLVARSTVSLSVRKHSMAAALAQSATLETQENRWYCHTTCSQWPSTGFYCHCGKEHLSLAQANYLDISSKSGRRQCCYSFTMLSQQLYRLQICIIRNSSCIFCQQWNPQWILKTSINTEYWIIDQNLLCLQET